MNTCPKPIETGHIYVVDLKACDTKSWMLSAILLHQHPFRGKTLKWPQCTSAANLKITSSHWRPQMLSIQHALKEGKRIYAEVAFSELKLLEETQEGMPKITGELVELSHIIVEHRRQTH